MYGQDNYATLYPNFIKANTRTLTKMLFSLWIFGVFDCGVFEECITLQTIVMTARPKKPKQFENPKFNNIP
jgi:hypothetical protein